MIVTHLMVGLGNGGAEAMLYNLLKFKINSTLNYQVVSLGGGNYYVKEIENVNIPLTCLDIKKNPIRAVFALKKIIERTDVLVCWMYHACLLGTFLIGKTKRKPILIWNIRHDNLDSIYNKKRTIWVAKQCMKRSSQADKVIYNGEPAKMMHLKLGFDKHNCVILGNGCDIEYFQHQAGARKQLEATYEIKGKKVILSVARYHKIKDFPLIFSTISRLRKMDKNIILIMCGPDVTIENEELKKLLEKYQLQYGEDVIFMGSQKNMPFWFSIADLYVLHSASEAFSNTLIQAMACAIPCISTDVGVARKLLNEEYIVPVSDPESMANCVKYVLEKNFEEWRKIGLENRKTIEDNYDIRQVVKKYEEEFALKAVY